VSATHGNEPCLAIVPARRAHPALNAPSENRRLRNERRAFRRFCQPIPEVPLGRATRVDGLGDARETRPLDQPGRTNKLEDLVLCWLRASSSPRADLDEQGSGIGIGGFSIRTAFSAKA